MLAKFVFKCHCDKTTPNDFLLVTPEARNIMGMHAGNKWKNMHYKQSNPFYLSPYSVESTLSNAVQLQPIIIPKTGTTTQTFPKQRPRKQALSAENHRLRETNRRAGLRSLAHNKPLERAHVTQITRQLIPQETSGPLYKALCLSILF